MSPWSTTDSRSITASCRARKAWRMLHCSALHPAACLSAIHVSWSALEACDKAGPRLVLVWPCRSAAASLALGLQLGSRGLGVPLVLRPPAVCCGLWLCPFRPCTAVLLHPHLRVTAATTHAELQVSRRDTPAAAAPPPLVCHAALQPARRALTPCAPALMLLMSHGPQLTPSSPGWDLVRLSGVWVGFRQRVVQPVLHH
jgi:hypothetical protein